MTFDNAAFTAKMADTIKGLDKLQQSLKMTEGTTGLKNVASEMQKVDVSTISQGIEGVSMKFLALSTIAITALAGIATKAAQVGGQIASSFTLDPVQQGFSEYETNLNSVQTILANTASKGSDLEDVNGALQKLNEYSDQTIYNFGEMAKNIGTFTAAGVDLDTSVGAIKGIANLAAISGSSSEQASTAMYQLSQALAAGKVSLMDWNSVVNAGMGGEVFKTALFETGKALGKITDSPVGETFTEWEAKGNKFRETLQDGWLTSEVLTTTLSSFTGDLTEKQLMALGYTKEQAAEMAKLGKLGVESATQVKTFTQLMGTVKEAIGTGWADSFKLVLGDFEGARKLFTGINTVIGNMVGKSARARNDMLADWANFGGRNAMLEGLINAFVGLRSIIDPIRLAFRTFFPKSTAATLLVLTDRFRNFAKTIKIGGDTQLKLYKIFSGFFAVLKFGIAVVKGVFNVITSLFGAIAGGGKSGGVLSVLAVIGDLLSNLGGAVDSGAVEAFFEGIANAASGLVRILVGAGTAVSDFFGNLFGGGGGGEKSGGPKKSLIDTGDAVKTLAGILEAAGNVFQNVGEAIGNVFSAIMSTVKSVGAVVGDVLKAMGIGDMDRAMDLLKAGLATGFTVSIIKVFRSLTRTFDTIQESIQRIGEGVADMFGELGDTLKAFQLKLKAEALQKIAIAIAILTASLVVLSFIDSGKLISSLAALSVGFGLLMGTMAMMKKLSLTDSAAELTVLAFAMMGMSVSALILAFAVKKLAALKWMELVKGLAAVFILVGALSSGMSVMGDAKGKMISAGLGLIAMALAMRVLAWALKSLSDLPFGELAKGVAGVSIAMIVLTKTLASIKEDEVAKKGLGMFLLAFSLRGVAAAIKIFADIPFWAMVDGLISMGAALFVLVKALGAMPPNLPAMAVGLGLVGIALYGISLVIEKLANMGIASLVTGILAVAAVLGVLAAATLVMNATGPGAAAILVVSGALVVLATAMAMIGGMSIASIAVSLLAIAAVLGTIAGAALLLTPVVPLIAALGIAVGILGIGLLAFGTGAYLAASAMALLATVGGKGVTTLIEVFRELLQFLPEVASAVVGMLTQMATEFLESLPEMITLVVQMLTMILDAIVEMQPQLWEAIGLMIDGFITTVMERGPAFVEAGFGVLMAFLTGLQQNFGQMATTGIMMVVSFINAIASNAGLLVMAGVNMLNSFTTAIISQMPRIVMMGAGLLVSFLNGLAMAVPMLATAAVNLIVTIINSIAGQMPRITEAGTNLILAFLMGIVANMQTLVQGGVDAILAFLDGVADSAIDLAEGAADALVDFLEGLERAIRSKGRRIREAGAGVADAIIDGIVEGIGDGLSSVVDAISGMAGSAIDAAKGVFGINSPSKVFAEIGSGLVEGLSNGISKDAQAIKSTQNLAKNVSEKMKSALVGVLGSVSELGDVNPTIAPVLDLTQVQSEAQKLAGMMDVGSITPDVSAQNARLISLSAKDSGSTEGDGVVVRDISFTQINNSPKALSTADIYRNGKGQFNEAVEELKTA